jgi:hypothetical protein
MEQGTSFCFDYLTLRSGDPPEEVEKVLNKLIIADPEQGKNCEWLIDSFIKKQFLLEDVDRVNEDIIKFKNIFGERRPLPTKGYSEMKIMIRESLEKESKKTLSKVSSVPYTTSSCRSYFKNVSGTITKEYQKKYSGRLDLDVLFDKIQNSNPTDNFHNCIWIVEEVKKGNIKEEELDEVKIYLSRYFKKSDLPLPNFYPNFPSYSNYQLVKDYVDEKVDLLSASDLGILLIPLTKDASCIYGAQTSWCTARKDEKNMFKHYSEKGNLYIWFDKILKQKYQFHFEENQFMDRDDNPIDKEILRKFAKHPILKPLIEYEFQKIKSTTQKINIAIQFFPEWDDLKSGKILQDVKLQDLLKVLFSSDMKWYILNIIKERWQPLEDIILNISKLKLQQNDKKLLQEFYVWYSQNAIKGRWKEAEDIILSISENMYQENKNIKKFLLPIVHQFNNQIKILSDYNDKIMNAPGVVFDLDRRSAASASKWKEGEYILDKMIKLNNMWSRR